MQDLLSVVDKHGRHLIAVGLFICALVDRAVIKAEDLGTGQAQKDRRMRNNLSCPPSFKDHSFSYLSTTCVKCSGKFLSSLAMYTGTT